MNSQKLFSIIITIFMAIATTAFSQQNENEMPANIENYNNMFLTASLGYANSIDKIDTVYKLYTSSKPSNTGLQHLQTEIIASTKSGKYIRIVVIYKSYRFDTPPTADNPFVISCIIDKSRYDSVEKLPECSECSNCNYKEGYYPEFAIKFLPAGNKIKKRRIKLPEVEVEKEIERD